MNRIDWNQHPTLLLLILVEAIIILHNLHLHCLLSSICKRNYQVLGPQESLYPRSINEVELHGDEERVLYQGLEDYREQITEGYAYRG